MRAAASSSPKIPRYVPLVDEFPITVTAKIRKVEMREKSVQLLSFAPFKS